MSCEMLGWMKHKLESRFTGEISITSDMQMTPPLWQKAKNLFAFLMKEKEESEKTGLKLNIQKTKILASSPITSWQIDGEPVETVSDFILGAPKSLQMVTATMKLKDACSLEEKLWPTYVCMLVAQLCPTLCDPMDCSPRLLCPWNSPGKNTGVDCHSLLQRNFPTQESNPGYLHPRFPT